MTPLRAILALVLISAGQQAFSEDVYLTGFQASSANFPVSCEGTSWTNDVHLFNQNPMSVEVQLVGLSNGGIRPGTTMSLTLPPGQVVSLRRSSPAMWFPLPLDPQYGLWVLHLDIPAGVVVENRDEVLVNNVCISPGPPDAHAKVSLPIVRALVEPNVALVKLGTDIGRTPAHQNVAIYNGGSNAATAHVEVRRACDNALTEERFATIEPNTIIQLNGMSSGTDCIGESVSPFARYTVVTVDQPSFSIVSTVANADVFPAGKFKPRVDLGVH